MNELKETMKTTLYMSVLLVSMTALPFQVDGQPKERMRAFEFTVGGSLVNYARIYVSDFKTQPDGSYLFDLKNKPLYGGMNLSLAYEIRDWMYFDVQGTLGMARFEEKGQTKQGFSLLVGPGIQFRPFNRSEWVQPFLRAGLGYFSKNFAASYFGIFSQDPTGEAEWKAEDAWNRGRTRDVNQWLPFSLGGGIIGWLDNRFGIRLQAEYLFPLSRKGAHFAQGTAGLMFRFGGKDKHRATADRYVADHLSDYDAWFADRVPAQMRIVEKRVEVPVEKIVEKEVVKEVRVEVPAEQALAELMDNVNFDFNEATLTEGSLQVLSEVARILNQFPGTHFLVAGYTDARGSEQYNERLSGKRAQAVYEALIRQGVDPDRLLHHGFGERMAMAPEEAPDEVRRGDRKVVMERITNDDLWNYLNR